MKKRFLLILLCLGLIASLAVSVGAETFSGGEGWRVAFTSQARMDSNFTSADLADVIAGMQPGDSTIFKLALTNENPSTTDWYMTNEVLYSLEDRSINAATNGGAYSYLLTYTDVNGTVNVLFDSDTVGGEGESAAGVGLHEATNALEDFFYLDTLAYGQQGIITLDITLDGETQGNDYLATLADLQMNFAVELDTTAPTPQIVKTGDETNMVPYLIAMGVSGVLLLILGIYSVKQRRSEQKSQGGA